MKNRRGGSSPAIARPMSPFTPWGVATLVWMASPSGLPAQGDTDPAHWRVVTGSAFKTVVAYDTTRLTKLPAGRYDVWERYTLHPPRVDPDGVVATIVLHIVVDCAARQTALKNAARYDKTGKLIKQTAVFSAGENDFSDENAGSVEAAALQGVCAAIATSGSH
jgi:hypothetical protein